MAKEKSTPSQMAAVQSEGNITPAGLVAVVSGDLESMIAACTPGGIERQEKAGQDRLVKHADRLPVDGTIAGRRYEAGVRAQWESVGFVFGDVLPEEGSDGQPLFVACTYPPGWTLVSTDHSMWSKVKDDKGRVRASVFFKAAFYDCHSHTFGLESRYSVTSFYSHPDGRESIGVKDTGTGELLYAALTYASAQARQDIPWKERHPADDEAEKKAEAWREEHFPDWKNPLAYWD